MEGVAKKDQCGGEGNNKGIGFGDICTGGLYRYDVQSNIWDKFLTNKDFQRGGGGQSSSTHLKHRSIPTARNDAVQWSERPMGVTSEQTNAAVAIRYTLLSDKNLSICQDRLGTNTITRQTDKQRATRLSQEEGLVCLYSVGLAA